MSRRDVSVGSDVRTHGRRGCPRFSDPLVDDKFLEASPLSLLPPPGGKRSAKIYGRSRICIV